MTKKKNCKKLHSKKKKNFFSPLKNNNLQKYVYFFHYFQKAFLIVVFFQISFASSIQFLFASVSVFILPFFVVVAPSLSPRLSSPPLLLFQSSGCFRLFSKFYWSSETQKKEKKKKKISNSGYFSDEFSLFPFFFAYFTYDKYFHIFHGKKREFQ